MHKTLLVSAVLLAMLPIATQAQTVGINLDAPVTMSGGNNQLLLGYPWGGGAQQTLSSTGEREVYETSGVTQGANGSLVLTARPNSNQSGSWPNNLPYVSGAVSTASINNGMPQPGGFSATQGTWSITASLPAGTGTSAGLWPAIWLEPVSGQGACEVDIMEAPFNNAYKYQASLHGGSGLGQVVNTTSPLTSMNTYSVNLSGSTITYYFNGQQVAQAPEPSTCNQPLYLLMNVAVGGESYAWSGTPNSSTQFPASMVIASATYTPGANGTFSGGLAKAAGTAAVVPPASGTSTGTTSAAGETSAGASGASPGSAGGAPPASAQAAATPTTAAAGTQDPTPGNGTATDCAGNVWSVNSNNKILENGVEVPGGGDTSDLQIQNCTVYGLSNGQNGSKVGWFTLSSVTPGNQEWSYMGATATPPGQSAAGPGTTAPPGGAGGSPAVTIPPLAVQSCPANGTATGGFHVADGQIIGPDGKPWIARGLDVHGFNLTAASQLLPGQFPGVNLVRVAVGGYGAPFPDPASFASAVTSLTSAGRVVEFTDYSNSLGTGGGGSQGVVFTGGLLGAESNWYAAMAAYYKSNPYVWFGTNNEPPTQGGSLSDWQLATYKAIRGTGNNNIIFLEPSGSRPPGYGGSPLQSGMNAADYAGMTNVVWDPHVYAYQDGYATDAATNDALVKAMISAAQTIQSADGLVPVIIGEYGADPQSGMAIPTAVVSAGAKGLAGSAAWAWDDQGSVDPTSIEDINQIMLGTGFTQYGQIVALYINTDVVPLTQCQSTAAAQTTINADTAAALAAPPTTPDITTTATDPAVAAGNQQAAALIAQGDGLQQQAATIASTAATQDAAAQAAAQQATQAILNQANAQ